MAISPILCRSFFRTHFSVPCDGKNPDTSRVKSCFLCQELRCLLTGCRIHSFHIDPHPVILAGTGELHALIAAAKKLLDLVHIDALSIHLQKPFFPSGDIVISLCIALCHVSGKQNASALVSLFKICRTFRISHRDIRTAIHKLPTVSGSLISVGPSSMIRNFPPGSRFPCCRIF